MRVVILNKANIYRKDQYELRRLAGKKMKRLAILTIVLSTTGKSTAADRPSDTSSLSGKVVETMDSGGYTYVYLERGGEKIWLAVPQMKVIVGQNMSFKPGIVMVDFESKTLKRKFDKIIFSEGPITSGNEE
jgi:hypothetical protein